MKAMDLIERVDLLEPNDYGPEQKLRWLTTLDGKAFREVIETHEQSSEHVARDPRVAIGGATDMLPSYVNGDEELLIEEPFALDVYYNYLQAMIAAENSETQRYNRRMVMFNAAYQEWTNWYNRTHVPKRAGTYFRF